MDRNSTTPPKRSRWRRRLLIALGLPLLFVAIGLGALFAVLRSDWGQAQLAETLGETLSDDEQMIAIEGLSGRLPAELQLTAVRVADRDGTWLTLQEARLQWSPWALLRGRLEIVSLTAEELQVERAPLATADSSTDVSSDEPFGLSDLSPPLPIALESLTIDHLLLGEPLVGEAFDLKVALSGEAAPESVALKGSVDEHGETGFRSLLDFAVAPQENKLTAALKLTEPPGGRLAQLLGTGSENPISVDLSGEGSLSHWDGAFFADLGDGTDAALTIGLRRHDALDLSVEGTLRPAVLLPEDLATLATPSVDVTTTLSLGDSQVRFDSLSLESGTLGLQLTGALGLEDGSVSAQGALDFHDTSILTDLVAPLVVGNGRADFTVRGSLETPAISLQPQLEQVSLPGLFLQGVSADLGLTLEGRPAVTLTASVEGFNADDATLQALVGQQATLSLAAESDSDFQQISLSDLSLSAAGLDLEGSGRVEQGDDGLRIVPELRIDLKQKGEGSPLPVSGPLNLSGDVTLGSDESLQGTLQLAGLGLQSSEEQLTKLIGPTPSLSVTFARQDGTVSIAPATLETSDLKASFNGRWQETEESLSGRLEAQVSNSSVLSDELSGPLTLTADVAGNLDSPGVSVTMDSSGLAVQGMTLPALTASARVELPADDRLEVSALKVALGKVELTGAMDVDLDSTLASGELTLSAPELTDLAALAELSLTGTLDATARLSTEGGQQAYALKAEAQSVDFDGITLSKANLTIDGTLTDDDASYRYSLDAEGLQPPGLEIASLTLEGEGSLAEVGFDLTAEGRHRQALSLEAKGKLALAESDVSLFLASLSLDHGQDVVTLSEPAELRFGADGYSGDLQASFNESEVSAKVDVGSTSASIDLSLDKLALSPLAALAGLPELEGTLSAKLSLSGPPTRPQGDYSIELSDIAMSEETDLPSLDGSFQGSYSGQRLSLTGELTGLSQEAARLSLAMPLELSLEPFTAAVPETGALEGSLVWNVALATLGDELDLDEHLISGNPKLDLRVAGTVAAPELYGSLSMSDGRYENLEYGVLVEDASFNAELDGDRIQLTALSANDGADGRLSGEGSIALRSDGESNLRVALNSFRAAQGDQVSAQLSGDATFSGTLLDHKIAGSFKTENVEVDIGQDLPASVVTLQVEEINFPSSHGAGTTSETSSNDDTVDEEPAVADTALDVTLDVPGRLFVRGRGLDSEWRGNFTVTGTAEDPRIDGLLEPVRGTFSLAGKTFTLEKGSIRFLPEQSEPFLDLTLTYTATDLTARIAISGTAADPTIELSSDPEQSQEEIIAEILFGRNTGQLSAVEALQVAEAAATLSGRGGLDPLGKAREILQLDTLTITTDEEGHQRLTAGTYIADDLFVGFEQGVTAGSGTAKAEYEVFPNIFLDARTSADSTGDVGVRWRLDY